LDGRRPDVIAGIVLIIKPDWSGEHLKFGVCRLLVAIVAGLR
jgi:hypothetical protein